MPINLLPEAQKKELEMEKTEERIFLILVFVFVAFLVFILMLFCLKTYIASQTRAADALLAQKGKEFTESHFQECKEIILNVNQVLSKVKGFWGKQFFIVPVFEELISLAPSSVQFESLEIKKEKDGASINLSGVSATREALFYFKENLEQDKHFREVDFLPSSWMLPVNSRFAATFKFASSTEEK